MTRPSPAQLERARRLLALERAAAGAEEPAEAAQRVLDKLHLQLDPLLGATGVHALLTRGAKLAQGKAACLADGAIFTSAAGLRDCLRRESPENAIEAAVALFGAFSELLGTFIGDRLTTQVLRSTWPGIEAIPATESNP